MFTGIIEGQSKLLSFQHNHQVLMIKVEKPNHFNDISLGDSIAVNGVCLTVENFTKTEIQFSLGPETLKVTGWTPASLSHSKLNLERSLKLDERIHGHIVSGHVDGMAQVSGINDLEGDTRILRIHVLKHDLMPFLWQKGSVTINGVSLTVNEVDDSKDEFEVCLIPETLKRTNLSQIKINDFVTLEVDTWARAYRRTVEWERLNKTNQQTEVRT